MIRLLSIYLCATTLLATFVTGQEESLSKEYQQAIESIDADLNAAIKELADIRNSIAAEKPEIARKAAKTAQQMREAKRKGDIARISAMAIEDELKQTENLLKLWRNERSYLDNLTTEFSKNYQSSILIPEALSLEKDFDESNPEGSLNLLTYLVNELPKLSTVRVIEGEALNKEGTMVDGKFAIAGPVAWFAAHDGSLSGLTDETRSLQSEVIEGITSASVVDNLLAGKTTTTTFDPTLGSAIAMHDAQSSFNIIGYIQKGGLWIYPILALAAVALIAALFKWLQVIGIRKLQLNTVRNIVDRLAEKKNEEALNLVGSIKHPARSLLETGIASSDQSVEDVEESVYQKYLEVLPRLQRGLPFIAIASATAPLLGLLGTVTGMIKTFDLINKHGTGNAQTLSGGISEALITTAFGLIVAIPALIIHAILSRKINGVRSDMEVASLSLINEIKNRIANKTWKTPST